MNIVATFLIDIINHAHPILNHFPIALLVVSWVLDQAPRWVPKVRASAWVTLVLGTVAALPTVVSGIIAGFPYEGSSANAAIETHERLGLATLLIFGSLTLWRWRSRRRGNEVGATWQYTVLGLVGVGVLLLTGYYGGNLVYELGVGVKGMQP
jgi:uncharacterized membrane protein